jgi:signal peptidase II
MAGKVTDFIDWYIGTHHWPAFNLADSFICVGVTLLVIESLFFTKK